MRKVFALFGTITLQGMEAVNKGMGKLDKDVRDVSRTIDMFGKNVTKMGMDLTKSLTVPIAAMSGAVVLAANKVGDYADRMFDLRDITALSTTTLQELEHVARVAGVNFEGLTSTITQFTKKLPQIVKEGGSAYESIKKYCQ